MPDSPARTLTLDVTILGRDFKVACKEDERDALMEAVALLDRCRSPCPRRGFRACADRIAVMAGLNIAHDLLRERRASTIASAAAPPPAAVGESFDAEAARRRIQAMQATIDETLAGQENLF